MTLEFVARQVWSPLPVSDDDLEESRLPARHLVFSYQTDTEPCYNKADCLRAVALLQRVAIVFKKLPDIDYNFLLGGDGRVYEGRGWFLAPPKIDKFKKDYPLYLLVGYIGDNKDMHYSEEIWEKAWSFIEFGVSNGYISKRMLPRFITDVFDNE